MAILTSGENNEKKHLKQLSFNIMKKQKKNLSESTLNTKYLGQVFTPKDIVQEMIALRRNKGLVLEPACGNGAFLNQLDKALGIELDKNIITNKKVLQCDFFAYSTKNKFSSIIGNPPYVRFQDILPETKKLLPMEWFDRRSNLYLFFIAKCLKHLKKGGELIFITPRDFLKATSARILNSHLYEQGSITYYRELGDLPVFSGYTPNCAIWRWEKACYNRHVSSGQGWFNHHRGQLWFGSPSGGHLSDLFDVKVGAVSGADHIFTNEKHGNADMVCSFTAGTGKTRKMIYNRKDQYLLPYKNELIKRRIRVFNENNWWEWGRKYCKRDGPRVYVNCKTRNSKPFFTHKSRAYDGSVMALFPKDPHTDVEKAVFKLNEISWNNLGFACDGRLIFTQRSLENAPVELSL